MTDEDPDPERHPTGRSDSGSMPLSSTTGGNYRPDTVKTMSHDPSQPGNPKGAPTSDVVPSHSSSPTSGSQVSTPPLHTFTPLLKSPDSTFLRFSILPTSLYGPQDSLLVTGPVSRTPNTRQREERRTGNSRDSFGGEETGLGVRSGGVGGR